MPSEQYSGRAASRVTWLSRMEESSAYSSRHLPQWCQKIKVKNTFLDIQEEDDLLARRECSAPPQLSNYQLLAEEKTALDAAGLWVALRRRVFRGRGRSKARGQRSAHLGRACSRRSGGTCSNASRGGRRPAARGSRGGSSMSSCSCSSARSSGRSSSSGGRSSRSDGGRSCSSGGWPVRGMPGSGRSCSSSSSRCSSRVAAEGHVHGAGAAASGVCSGTPPVAQWNELGNAVSLLGELAPVEEDEKDEDSGVEGSVEADQEGFEIAEQTVPEIPGKDVPTTQGIAGSIPGLPSYALKVSNRFGAFGIDEASDDLECSQHMLAENEAYSDSDSDTNIASSGTGMHKNAGQRRIQTLIDASKYQLGKMVESGDVHIQPVASKRKKRIRHRASPNRALYMQRPSSPSHASWHDGSPNTGSAVPENAPDQEVVSTLAQSSQQLTPRERIKWEKKFENDPGISQIEVHNQEGPAATRCEKQDALDKTSGNVPGVEQHSLSKSAKRKARKAATRASAQTQIDGRSASSADVKLSDDFRNPDDCRPQLDMTSASVNTETVVQSNTDAPVLNPKARAPLSEEKAKVLAMMTAGMHDGPIMRYMQAIDVRKLVLAVPVDAASPECADMLDISLGIVIHCEAVDVNGFSAVGTIVAPRELGNARGCFLCKDMLPVVAEMRSNRFGNELELDHGLWMNVGGLQQPTTQGRLRHKALQSRIKAFRASWEARAACQNSR